MENNTQEQAAAVETPEEAQKKALAEIAAQVKGTKPAEGEAANGKAAEPMTVADALKRLEQMTKQRDALIEAISEHKKYVQKLVGKL